MVNTLWRLYGRFAGRLTRSAFIGAALALTICFTVLFVFLDTTINHQSTLLLYPPLAWSITALVIKRLHDRGHSCWRLSLLLIPILGPLWISISLICRRGTPGENQFGDDPRTRNVDYYTV